MEDLIQSWKNKKDGAEQRNKKLVKKLQQHKGKRLDNFATELHKQVFKQLDCLDCAGCCTGLPPIVNSSDATRIAKKIGLSLSEFEQQYLTIDEDKDSVLKTTPCPFLLDDKKCSIYEFRPKACREYPHTDLHFSQHLDYHATNSLYCPATFHILERLKKALSI